MLNVRCFKCKNSIPDPEIGYTCKLGRWNDFKEKGVNCLKYNFDINFVINFVKKEEKLYGNI